MTNLLNITIDLNHVGEQFQCTIDDPNTSYYGESEQPQPCEALLAAAMEWRDHRVKVTQERNSEIEKAKELLKSAGYMVHAKAREVPFVLANPEHAELIRPTPKEMPVNFAIEPKTISTPVGTLAAREIVAPNIPTLADGRIDESRAHRTTSLEDGSPGWNVDGVFYPISAFAAALDTSKCVVEPRDGFDVQNTTMQRHDMPHDPSMSDPNSYSERRRNAKATVEAVRDAKRRGQL